MPDWLEFDPPGVESNRATILGERKKGGKKEKEKEKEKEGKKERNKESLRVLPPRLKRVESTLRRGRSDSSSL